MYIDMCHDMCVNMCLDLGVDMHIDICVCEGLITVLALDSRALCADACTMCMCTDMCMLLHVDICADIWVRHMQGLLCSLDTGNGAPCADLCIGMSYEWTFAWLCAFLQSLH